MRSVGIVLGVLSLLSGSACAQPGASDLLDQNWNAAQKRAWHGGTQGSRLVPWAWLDALEQPDGTGRFLDPGYFQRFRYLAGADGDLPLGFALDDQKDDALSFTHVRWKAGQSDKEKWVGMTCAACHTAQITYQQHVIQVEGAPTRADFQSFMEAFDKALTQTRDDGARFERFAAKVLAGSDDAANRTMLKDAFAKWLDFHLAAENRNQVAIRYGYGRLDAFGRIFNRVVAIASPSSKGNPADAPVSYPFLWNVPQHDKVQWNGIASNVAVGGVGGQPFDFGALGRNTAEVIGVFADIQASPNAGLHGFVSSTDVAQLNRLELLLTKLRPPRWPAEIFGATDDALAARGKVLFEARCATCHQHLDRTDLATRFQVEMSPLRPTAAEPAPIGTDIWMACNAYADVSSTGKLKGVRAKYVTGTPLAAEAPLTDMLTAMALGALIGKKVEIAESAAQNFFGLQRLPEVVTRAFTVEAVTNPRDTLRQRCTTETSPLLAYKGRPLTGIWATAPYLHNGSVPTLDDLLLPPSQRPKQFYVGTREFDPVKVGFVTAQSADNDFLFRTEDASGNPLDGNSSAGHDYGNAGFTPDDRKALVEYMKTL